MSEARSFRKMVGRGKSRGRAFAVPDIGKAMMCLGMTCLGMIFGGHDVLRPVNLDEELMRIWRINIRAARKTALPWSRVSGKSGQALVFPS